MGVDVCRPPFCVWFGLRKRGRLLAAFDVLGAGLGFFLAHNEGSEAIHKHRDGHAEQVDKDACERHMLFGKGCRE